LRVYVDDAFCSDDPGAWGRWTEHYDLTGAKRDLAIHLGAIRKSIAAGAARRRAARDQRGTA
jgi:hypothetical protein